MRTWIDSTWRGPRDSLTARVGRTRSDRKSDASGNRTRASTSQIRTAYPTCFFDVEGWASMWSHRTHGGYLSAEIGVGQSSNTGRPEVLMRFADVLGGRVYGPYKQTGATMDVYKLKASALRDFEEMATKIRPR